MAPFGIRTCRDTFTTVSLRRYDKTANGEGALRDGIDLTIRTEHWRDQERTARRLLDFQARRRIRRSSHLGGQRREVAPYHNGGDVLGIERTIVRIDAKPLQHADQALFGEDVARKRSPVPFRPTTNP